MNTELPKGAQGKFQFIESSWDKIHLVKIDPPESSLTVEKITELISKFKTIKESAKGASKKMNSFIGSKDPHPVEKICINLARCASKIYGPNNVVMDWHSNMKSMLHTVGIRVQKPGEPLNKYQWVCKFTDEFLWQWDEQGDSEKASKDIFSKMLQDMCSHFDKHFELSFALPVSHKMWMQDGDPWNLQPNTTQSSYEFLSKTGFITKVFTYWNVKQDEAGPVMKSWFAETGFETGLWLDENGSSLSGGGISYGMGNSGNLMKNICPGLTEIVNLPCGCQSILGAPLKNTVENVIIHLNDKDEHMGVKKEWSREEIADWLESLDVDLSLRDNSSNDIEKEN